MNVTHLYCSACAAEYEPNKLYNLCAVCGKPLMVAYDLEKAAATLTKESLEIARSDALALRGSFAGRKHRKPSVFRRRNDAAQKGGNSGREIQFEKSVYQRRIAQPDAEL